MLRGSSVDDEFREDAVLGLQLIEGALLSDSAVLEHDNVAAEARGVVGSLSEVNGSHSRHRVLQSLLHLGFLLRLVLHAEGNVVHEQDLRLEHDGSGNLKSLLLVERQLAALAHSS